MRTTLQVAAASGRTQRPVVAAPESAEHRRIAALDGLRGVAVVGVVLYHAGHLRGGFLGVDLFFVLSGYLITTILLRSWHQDGGVDLRRFWSRRARRLLPALLLLLVVVLPVYCRWFATRSELTSIRRDGITSLLYVTNWGQILSGHSYWAAYLAESPLKHMWSLAIEEQFYLLWPLAVVVVARRYGARAVLWLAGGLSLLSASATVLLAATNAVSYNSLYLGTHTRAAALLAGAALAAWHRQHGRARTRRSAQRLESAAIAAIVVLGVMWVFLPVPDSRLYLGGLAISGAAGTLAVAAAASPFQGPLNRALSIRPLRFLGTISYGIYLWSWPIGQMISVRHTGLGGWTLVLVQVSVTLAAATASWVLVEKPILKGALQPPASRPFLFAGVVAATIAVLVNTAGAISEVPTSASTAGYVRAATPGATRMMIIGDSVPNRIAQEGIIPLRNELGVSVLDRSAPGCLVLAGLGPVKGIEGNIRTEVGPCDLGWRDDVQTYRPRVVLAMFGQFPNDEVHINGTFNLPCTPAYNQAMRVSLEKAVGDLSSTGARVVFATAPGSTVSWMLENVPPGMNERMACLNEMYTDLAAEHPNVDVIDFAEQVCPSVNECKDTIEGIDLREDVVHFRGDSAEWAARWLVHRALATS